MVQKTKQYIGVLATKYDPLGEVYFTKSNVLQFRIRVLNGEGEVDSIACFFNKFVEVAELEEAEMESEEKLAAARNWLKDKVFFIFAKQKNEDYAAASIITYLVRPENFTEEKYVAIPVFAPADAVEEKKWQEQRQTEWALSRNYNTYEEWKGCIERQESVGRIYGYYMGEFPEPFVFWREKGKLSAVGPVESWEISHGGPIPKGKLDCRCEVETESGMLYDEVVNPTLAFLSETLYQKINRMLRGEVVEEKIEKPVVEEKTEEPKAENFFTYLYGPLGSGKTTRLRQWITRKETERKTTHKFYFYSSLLMAVDFYEYWMDMFKQFATKIPESKLTAAVWNFAVCQKAQNEIVGQERVFCNKIQEIYKFAEEEYQGTLVQKKKIIQYVPKLFWLYAQLDIQVTLVMDDLDYAKALGEKSGDKDLVFRMMYNLANGRDQMKTLHLVLVANKSLEYLCEVPELSAGLALACVNQYVEGYSEQEMEEYFDTFTAQGYMTKKNRKRIQYYCGYHPGLLQKFRILFETKGAQVDYDIERLFEENRAEFFSFYEYFYTRLCRETVHKNGEPLSLLSVFLNTYCEQEEYSLQPWMDWLAAAGICRLSNYFVKYVLVKVHPEKIDELKAAMEEKEKRLSRFPIPTQEEIEDLVGKQVVYCHERLSKSGGGRGFIVTPRFGACMSKKRRQNVKVLPGMDIDVVVDCWNTEVEMFEVIPVLPEGEYEE